MARIAGIDLPVGKRIEIALTYIYGIGRAKAHSILDRAKVDHGTKVRDLTEDEVGRIRRIMCTVLTRAAGGSTPALAAAMLAASAPAHAESADFDGAEIVWD